ncbi:Uncharacterized protein PECH_000418 [Penicillium ucsense]|uniref:Cyclin N-terminal domain-containing protein n=1 Tax=Penicillium ucsense TaxID=2839758 RepID=A0A8J8VZ43_9EURO|nr:Uncharacterized protein PECM_008467 [Penicillium ucsense]KAF7733576.1 Uncharacterized protein PECH_000418 [Penicillium ucsense]
MDAKPQRIRGYGDENVPPTFIAAKTIHSRNEPATVGLWAQKAIGNIETSRQACEDKCNIKIPIARTGGSGKLGAGASDDKRALSQPAQRPFSGSGVKGILPNIGSRPMNTAGKALPNGTRINAKRANVVFHDQPEPAVEHEASKEDKVTAQTLNCEIETTGIETTKGLSRTSGVNVEISKHVSAQAEPTLDHTEESEKVREEAKVASVDCKYASLGTEGAVAIDSQESACDIHQSPDMTGPALSDPEYSEDDETHGYHYRSEHTTGSITTVIYPNAAVAFDREILRAKQVVEDSLTAEEIEEDLYDSSMVAEYATEIFDYLRIKEIEMLPAADYMTNQGEIQWSMRSILMDWLVQVHLRFKYLPETLFLCVNLVDRFLSRKVVSMGKLQLVGATALFIAAKYEEVSPPSINEILFMVDGGYTVDEILKAERFMLNILNYDIGWPGPMSFLRRISKADDYDLETRTIAKYFLELTIMDERFVATPPSFLSAGAHCLALLMLRKGCWTMAHAYYSGYLYTQLIPVMTTILECCEDPREHHQAIFEKYTERRFKRASTFVEQEILHGFRVPRPTPFVDANRLAGLANY